MLRHQSIHPRWKKQTTDRATFAPSKYDRRNRAGKVQLFLEKDLGLRGHARRATNGFRLLPRLHLLEGPLVQLRLVFIHFRCISAALIAMSETLCADKCGIRAALLDQLLMCSLLHNRSICNDGNVVGVLDCGQFVSRDQHSTTLGYALERVLYNGLSVRV